MRSRSRIRANFTVPPVENLDPVYGILERYCDGEPLKGPGPAAPSEVEDKRCHTFDETQLERAVVAPVEAAGTMGAEGEKLIMSYV